jgi:hypothetical protein
VVLNLNIARLKMKELISFLLPNDPKLLMWIIILGAGAWYNLKSEQIRINEDMINLQQRVNNEWRRTAAILPDEIKVVREKRN